MPTVEAALLGATRFQWMARRSVRRYLPQPVPQALVDRLLEAAVTAPSAHNRQPWRFAVLDTARHKIALACAMGERLRRDRRGDHDPNADIEADVARSFARITGAATVIIVCLSMEDMDVYPDEARSRNEHQMAVQSTAMAGQNVLLTAHAAGLGACWLCAPMFCPDTVRDALGLPAHWEPQGMITLGYPADAGKPFVRKPMPQVVMRLRDTSS
ncbi:MAG TPA: nitroreductase family protein [Ramlibacter sp.]|nr:nitroreductase family protein [Ramlibacter sp.]